MAKHRLHISVDLDNTVTNLAKKWLELYNAEHGKSATAHDLQSWDMAKNFDIGTKIYRYLDVPHLFTQLEALPGACEAVKLLNEEHEVHIISTASKLPHTWSDKISWCEEHLPFIERQQITLTAQKHRFLTDIFIEDAPHNLREHAKAQPHARRIGIAWPYNYEVRDLMDCRAASYEDTLGAWNQMLGFVEGCAAYRERKI